MARTRWSDLSPGVRRTFVVAGAVDTALKVAALVDLARQRPEAVRGSKARWAAALTVVNSVGILPVVYFAYGRRR